MFLEADPSPLSRKERGSQNPPQPSLFTGRESEVEIMNELGEIIREEIGARGPMTFARYIELALYHPALGYYAGGAEGTRAAGLEWRLLHEWGCLAVVGLGDGAAVATDVGDAGAT